METSCQYAASGCTNHTLPFTGFELIALVGLAVALVVMGLAMRFSYRGGE